MTVAVVSSETTTSIALSPLKSAMAMSLTAWTDFGTG